MFVFFGLKQCSRFATFWFVLMAVLVGNKLKCDRSEWTWYRSFKLDTRLLICLACLYSFYLPERGVKSQPLAVRRSGCNSYANAGLLDQDESLATHESLVSMALRAPGFQATSTVTTFIMPDSSRKLEQLVTSSTAPGSSSNDIQQILRVMKVHPGKNGSSAEVY